MAIDTKSLSQLIAEFRKLQTKDSITPESLGYILQRIADLLATAGTTRSRKSTTPPSANCSKARLTVIS